MIRGGARARIDGNRTVVLERPDSLRGSDDNGLFASLDPALFLVDGGNLLWRAAHGHPAPFTADDGRNLTPVFRFFTILRRALGTYGLFAECIVCFDGEHAWTARMEIDASYKSNRRYDAERLRFMTWLPEIRAALACAGVVSIELDDQEADDVIATLAARSAGRTVRVLSTDRDYYQLVSSAVTVANGRGLVDEASVLARYGVRPDQWCDFRALAGDPSDGIPGLPGIGPKRAAELLADGRTLDDLRTLDGWPDASRWRELIRLRTDVPTGVRPSGIASPKLPSPVAVCRELGLIRR